MTRHGGPTDKTGGENKDKNQLMERTEMVVEKT